MNTEVKISVIVPVYKVEKYLDRCVESIVNQTYKNLEIILVDDGSPDNCPAMCDAWAKKDERIRVIHKENGGLSSARNAGIDESTGDCIFFLDSDDYIRNDCLDVMLSRLEKDESEMCISNVQMVDEEYSFIGTPEPKKDEIISKEKAFSRLGTSEGEYYVISCAKLYKKFIFEEVRFPESKLHEDEFVYYKIIDKCNIISIVSDSLYFYLKHKGSITGCISKKRLDAVEAFYYQALFFLETSNIRFIHTIRKSAYMLVLDVLSHNDVWICDPSIRTALKYFVEICKMEMSINSLTSLTKIQKFKFILICFLYTYPFNRVTKKIKRFVE